VAELEEELPPMPVEADDLTVIEGIGPKIARTLEAAGIGTFRELASAEVSRLVEILSQDRNLRMHNPESWPEQARLAAAGEWAALQTMQAGLRGGRQAE
jgi:large subunit ribosomal protein L17